jgi:hypothetical protein
VGRLVTLSDSVALEGEIDMLKWVVFDGMLV